MKEKRYGYEEIANKPINNEGLKELFTKQRPMTEKLERKAEQFADKHAFRVPYDGSNKFYDDTDYKASKDGYIAGATENGIQWHDLRKDPNDLPKDNGTVLVRLEKPIMKFSYFCRSEKKFSVWNKEHGCNVQLHSVIAWYEIPQFKE